MDWFIGRSRRKAPGGPIGGARGEAGGIGAAGAAGGARNHAFGAVDCNATADAFMPRSVSSEICEKQHGSGSGAKDLSICDHISADDFRKLVMLPPSVTTNEWIASHVFALFHHVNVIYGSLLTQFCTPDSCPSMIGLNNTQYSWVDEKGKKSKCSAAQYVDYVMSFLERSVHDESVFPTKYGQEFPSDFMMVVKRMMNLMSHVVSHLLHVHRLHVLRLMLESHVLAVVDHFLAFSAAFGLLDAKAIADLTAGLAPLRQQNRTTVAAAVVAANRGRAGGSALPPPDTPGGEPVTPREGVSEPAPPFGSGVMTAPDGCTVMRSPVEAMDTNSSATATG